MFVSVCNHSVTVLNPFLCTRLPSLYTHKLCISSIVISTKFSVLLSWHYLSQTLKSVIVKCQPLSTFIRSIFEKFCVQIVLPGILNLVWFMRSIFFSPFLLCIEVSNYIYEHQEVNMDYVQGMTKQLKMSVWYIYIYIYTLALWSRIQIMVCY